MERGRLRIAPTKHYLRELKKLPADLKVRIGLATEEIALNPYGGVRLKGELEGLFRWRVGEYRMIYKIDEQKGYIVLVDVGPRRSIYDS